jgi:hypothetical protein
MDFSSSQSKFQENLTIFAVIQKQICNPHIFTHHVVVLTATTSNAVFLPHTSAITIEAS